MGYHGEGSGSYLSKKFRYPVTIGA